MSPVRPLLLALLLAGCATHEFPDSSRLYGQNLDAARAIYGEWNLALNLEGKDFYVWRRGVEFEGQPVFCELFIEVGQRRTIARRYVKGHPAACQLF